MWQVACFSLVFLNPGVQKSEKNRESIAAPQLSRTFVLEGLGGKADGTGIIGRLDHLGYDPDSDCLFVACKANGSLEVIDLKKGKRIATLPNLAKPQGVGIYQNKAYVTTGGDGQLHRVDLKSFKIEKSIAVGEDADNVRVSEGRIWVSYGGDGPGGIKSFDPETLAEKSSFKFPKMPEGFRLSKDNRLFVNMPAGKRSTEDGTLLCLDATTGKIHWEIKLKGRGGNFALSRDETNDRLLLSTRFPARLIALTASKGEFIGDVECPPDSDDLFWDAKTRQVIVIGGGQAVSGSNYGGNGAAIATYSVDKTGKPIPQHNLPLPAHTRTGLFVPEKRTVYVAVPPLKGQPAEIREYSVPE